MARRRQALEAKRRKPRQARAAETVRAILEGAAQVLEAGGLAALTTNAVAERAGVSIGTLYQYFADKQALLAALAEQEIQAALAAVARALDDNQAAQPAERVRAVVRAIVHAFGGRQRARKALLQAVLSQGGSGEMLAPVAAFIAQAGSRQRQEAPRAFPVLGREQLFVLTRAVMGTIRAAVLEEQPFLKSRSFEDELVRLALGYFGALAIHRAQS